MRAVCLAWLLMLSAPAVAQTQANPETVFVGELRSMTLTPRDRHAERRAREATGEMVISNSCGTALATFRVLHAARRLPREVRTNSTIGEWCDPPVPLSQDRRLVVIDARTRELLANYEIVEQQGASYALVLDTTEQIRLRAAEVQQMLHLETLPEPIEYDVTGWVSQDGLADWVARRPALELRDGGVWIARAVPLSRMFPALSME
jgi:hypothetical protein